MSKGFLTIHAFILLYPTRRVRSRFRTTSIPVPLFDIDIRYYALVPLLFTLQFSLAKLSLQVWLMVSVNSKPEQPPEMSKAPLICGPEQFPTMILVQLVYKPSQSPRV